MESIWHVLLMVVAALIVFSTGVLLTRAERPYGTALLTVHKLVDLAVVVFIAIQAFAAVRGLNLTSVDWVLLIAALLVVVATLVTGGMVSASDSVAMWLVKAHRLLPWPLLVLLAATVYRFTLR